MVRSLTPVSNKRPKKLFSFIGRYDKEKLKVRWDFVALKN